ncbi:MAG: D-Ala-D-Ala carboxypeptidase family metallohydrolase [Desulfobulbaceae bacterium]|nr:D-Ala-D-Ala carboxypeptidase family metallohydrolase [Desulfobulbaceae bacterium]
MDDGTMQHVDQITPHFSLCELQCRCGCGRMGIDPAFLERLEDLRVAFNSPMIIASGYRCPEYNDRISTTGRTGPHTRGAVDILIHGKAAHILLHMAFIVGFSGIGIRQSGPMSGRFIHLDNLTTHNNPRPRVWTY